MEAAEALGVTERTFTRWKASEWFPGASKTAKGFDLEMIRAAKPRESDEQASQSSELRKLRIDLETAKVKEKIAASQMAEMRAREKAGSLIPRHAHELHWSQFLTEFSVWCEQVPEMAAMQLPKKYQEGLRKFLKGEFERRRNAAADKLTAMAKEYDLASAKAIGAPD